jgi:hypothetical protein
MKKLILILCIAFYGDLAGLCPPIQTITIAIGYPIEPYNELFNAVCMIESSMRPRVINKKEQAYGLVQVRKGKLADFNRLAKKNYSLQDCLDPKIAKEIFMFFAVKYHYTQSETIARKWNGKGYKTTIYWNKVKKQMNKQKS